jgi:hypothetical protein
VLKLGLGRFRELESRRYPCLTTLTLSEPRDESKIEAPHRLERGEIEWRREKAVLSSDHPTETTDDRSIPRTNRNAVRSCHARTT